MYRGGQLRDISEVSQVGVTTIQQLRHLGPFTHPLSSSPSIDHDLTMTCWKTWELRFSHWKQFKMLVYLKLPRR